MNVPPGFTSNERSTRSVFACKNDTEISAIRLAAIIIAILFIVDLQNIKNYICIISLGLDAVLFKKDSLFKKNVI
jgi:hypothetical protein